MKIFIDLDDTLIKSLFLREIPSDLRPEEWVGVFDDELYLSEARLSGYKLLDFCRRIDKNVNLLTTATRKWAEYWNKVFDLGFKKEEVISRHDFLKFEDRYDVKKTLALKNAVIIDDKRPRVGEPLSFLKAKYVFGENSANWVQVPRFRDNKNRRIENLLVREVAAELVGLLKDDIMSCSVCGGKMLGDGYTEVLHCERIESSGIEPDAMPRECEGDE